MHLVIKLSKEGELPGLDWVDTETISIRFDPKESELKVIHMGLNTVKTQCKGALLLRSVICRCNPSTQMVHLHLR